MKNIINYYTSWCKNHLRRISPKESTIAIEVFGKDLNAENFDSSSVRVYMHNLRQKLDSTIIQMKDMKMKFG